jgi:hypothetical protein
MNNNTCFVDRGNAWPDWLLPSWEGSVTTRNRQLETAGEMDDTFYIVSP